MTLLSFPIPSLVQGVSQQAPQQIRPTQCIHELNRLNSVVEGNIKRPGFEHVRFHPGEDWSDAFFTDIIRSPQERSRVVINNGSLRVFDLITGNERAVSFPNGGGYLAHTGPARDAFRVCNVADAIYLVNRQIKPAMGTERTPTRPPEGFAYFRAGNYSTTYSITIGWQGDSYTWSVGTMDASDAAHEPYIRTNYLTAIMFRLLKGTIPAGDDWAGSGDRWGSNGNRTYTASPGPITDMGFSIAKNTNVIRIWRNDGQEFTMTTEDGQGDTYLVGMKEHVNKFSDLPANGWHGVVLKVRGSSREVDDDYWVRYNAGITAATDQASSMGVWEEAPKPGTVLGFDPETMPHYLLSLDNFVFSFKPGVWSKRVAGDGVESAKDPSFVGRAIQDVFFERGRLGFITTGAISYSKSRQHFTFFPDTIQTVLDTDCIDVEVAGTETAVVRWATAFNEQLLLWADGTQYAVKGQDTLTQKTIEVRPMTNFKADMAFKPRGGGNFLYFTSLNGGYGKVWEMFVSNKGLNKDATDATAQAPRYVPGNVHHISTAADQHMLGILSLSDRSQMTVYNFFRNGDEKMQSAWSRWTVRPGQALLYGNFVANQFYAILQSSAGVSFEVLDVGPGQRDPDGGAYRTRLDGMVAEDKVLQLTYYPLTNRTTFVLPHKGSSHGGLTVVSRESATRAGGRQYQIVSVEDVAFGGTASPGDLNTTVTVAGDLRGVAFYVGYVYRSERTFPQFWPRDEKGVLPFDRIQVHSYKVTYSGTGYLRAEVEYASGETRRYEMVARRLGSPTNLLGRIGIQDGEFGVPVKSENTRCKVTLVNDTFLPDTLQAASVQYRGALRTKRV